MKKHFSFFLLPVFCFAMLALSCNNLQQPVVDSKADADAIRQTDIEWARVTEAMQLDDSTGYYSYLLDDEVLLTPNAPMVNGKKAIREMLGPMFAMPGFGVKWQPTKAEASGDLGYTIGTYEMTFNDSTGAAMTEKGKYLEIWKRQADGKWKVAAESFNSDMPLEPPTN